MTFNFNFESLSIINKNKIQKIIERHNEKEKRGKEKTKKRKCSDWAEHQKEHFNVKNKFGDI
jgi:hypothetical protein